MDFSRGDLGHPLLFFTLPKSRSTPSPRPFRHWQSSRASNGRISQQKTRPLWVSIQITADLYGHLFKETSVAAMRRLQEGMPVGDVRDPGPRNGHPSSDYPIHRGWELRP